MTSNLMDNDKCVTVGNPAWHVLGKNFQEEISAEVAHDEMGGSFELFQKPVGVQFEDEFITIPNSFAIVRGPTNKDDRSLVFGYMTKNYHIVQPIEIIKKFDEKVGVSISSMGLIQDGRKLFLCWKLPTFEVVKDDPIDLYGSVLFGFDKIFSSRLNISTVRIVCENTFVANINEADAESKKNRGRGTIYSGKHSNRNLLYELGEWMGHIQEKSENEKNMVQGFFKKLTEKKIVHEKQAQDLIYATWPNPKPISENIPRTLKVKEQEKIDIQADKMERIRVGIWDVFSTSRGIAVDQDSFYGLFNSATQYFNHEQVVKKDATYSTIWGNRSAEMNKFASVLSSEIK